MAFTLTGYGDVLAAMGDHIEAIERYERAIAIREAVHGREHGSVGYTLGQLANAHFFRGDLDAAQAAYERAIAILEKASGPASPIVASSLVGLEAWIAARK